MKTCELESEDLNYWVAVAEGWSRVGQGWHTKPGHRESKDYPGTILNDWGSKGPHDFLVSPDGEIKIAYCGCESTGSIPDFSGDWAQGGPIIESERITILDPKFCKSGEWEAFIDAILDVRRDDIIGRFSGAGDTPLIAAMRCYVASKFGEEVSHPKEGA